MNFRESLLGIAAIALVITPALIPAIQTFGQQQQDEDITPAPSIGADIPLTYFGPAPCIVQKETKWFLVAGSNRNRLKKIF